MLTRVQLNLLGRRSYLSSVVSLATGTAQSTISLENNDDDNPEQGYSSDFETNQKYLTFSWWLLNRGWVELMENVEAAVRDVFGHLSPRDLLSFDTLSELTLEVRKKMEGRGEGADKKPGAKWLPYLLPPTKMEDFVLRESGILGDSAAAAATQQQQQQQQQPDASSSSSSSSSPPAPSSEPALRRLLDETSDLVESPAFAHVLTLLLDAGFRTLLHKKVLPGAFELPASTFTAPAGADLEQVVGHQAAAAAASGKVVLLPKILSVLTRQAHAVGNGMPNEYLRDMEQVRDLEAFAAVVYSSNWENEIHQDPEGSLGAAAAARGLPVGGSDEASVGAGVEGEGEGEGGSAVGVGRFSQVSTLGEESMVLVEPASQAESSFENAWAQATERN